MRKVTEVLRLDAQGLSRRQIAMSTGMSRAAVREYLIRAGGAGLSWPLPEGMDGEALEGRLFPPIVAVAERPVPEWRAVHRELKSRRHHVTLRLLWLEWKADNPDGWCYSQFCQHYRDWLGAADVVMRLCYAGGERMFVDFSGDKAPDWVGPDSGEVHRDEVFVSVLGACGLIYAEATAGQDLDSWIGAHVHAWEAYGGVAAVTTPDNLRAGVSKACWYDPLSSHRHNGSYAATRIMERRALGPCRGAGPGGRDGGEVGIIRSG